MKWNSFVVAASAICVATVSVGFVQIAPKVIYGEDNRQDVYLVPRADIRDVADSTVAMISNRDLKRNGRSYLVRSSSLGQSMNLCSDERFFDQPAAANCSGVLVGPDLVATAGHCVSNADCSSWSFVFGYRMMDETTAPVELSEEEVYACKEVVARKYTSTVDFALVRLDRTVRGHRILNLQQTSVSPGDELYVVGHPSGLPTKVADGAKVRELSTGFFKANLDTYGGNSGSAVLNAKTNDVVGILVRGDVDYVFDSKNSCRKSNVCETDSCRGEDVTNISYVIEALKK